MQGAEAFSRRNLFKIMDDLVEAARKRVTAEKGGKDALKPYILSHALAGNIEEVRRI